MRPFVFVARHSIGLALSCPLYEYRYYTLGPVHEVWEGCVVPASSLALGAVLSVRFNGSEGVFSMYVGAVI